MQKTIENKTLFYGEIRHTEKTLHRMFSIQMGLFHRKAMLFFLFTGFLMIAGACFLNLRQELRIFLLFIGALLIMGREVPAAVRAADRTEVRKGRLPVYTMRFSDAAVTLSGEGEMKIPYDKLWKLVSDRQYFYLFLDKESLMMVDQSTVTPEAARLKAFLEEKTGKSFQSGKSALMLTFWDILELRSNEGGNRR